MGVLCSTAGRIAIRICETPVLILEQGRTMQTVHVTRILIQLHLVEQSSVMGYCGGWGGWDPDGGLIANLDYGQCTLNSLMAALNEIKHLFSLPTLCCTPYNFHFL